jgi:hypothetical protein
MPSIALNPNPSSSQDLVAVGDSLVNSSRQETYFVKPYLQDMVLHGFVTGVRTVAADLRLFSTNP